MFTKSIIMLLGAIILLQGYNAAPYKDEDSALQALVGRLKLMKFVETERVDIDKDILSKDKVIMEKVLKDPKVLEIKDEKIKKVLDRIRNFLKEYEEFERTDKRCVKRLNKLIDQHDMIVDQYADEKTAEDIPEVKTIIQSFKENGFERLPEPIKARYKTLGDNFYNEVQKYVDGLSETEKKNDISMLELLKELKDETDIEKRDNLIWMFFGRLRLDDFMW